MIMFNDYPMEKYTFIVNEEKKTVIALTKWQRKTVKAVAKCSPNDTFDVEYGKKLAAARCNVKVAEKRMQRAIAKNNEVIANSIHWDCEAVRVHQYFADAEAARTEARNQLNEIYESSK